jgi:hypothetical protein
LCTFIRNILAWFEDSGKNTLSPAINLTSLSRAGWKKKNEKIFEEVLHRIKKPFTFAAALEEKRTGR